MEWPKDDRTRLIYTKVARLVASVFNTKDTRDIWDGETPPRTQSVR